MTVAKLNAIEITELEGWAQQVRDEANGWAERAEVSRGERRELTKHLDALASRAAQLASVAQVLNA